MMVFNDYQRATVRGYLLRIILYVIHSVSQIELSLNPRSQCLHNLGSCHLEVAPALELIHWKNIFKLFSPLQYSFSIPMMCAAVCLNLKHIWILKPESHWRNEIMENKYSQLESWQRMPALLSRIADFSKYLWQCYGMLRLWRLCIYWCNTRHNGKFIWMRRYERGSGSCLGSVVALCPIMTCCHCSLALEDNCHVLLKLTWGPIHGRMGTPVANNFLLLLLLIHPNRNV